MLGIAHVETRVQDVQSLDVPAKSVDIAYARWVLCFTPRPQDVVARVAAALKPGGVFAVQDYINWGALSLSPKSDAFLRVMPSVGKSWRDHGGDWQVGARLPAMMASHGLRVEAMLPLQRIARSTDPLWQWPTTFFASFIPRLVEQGLVSESDWREMQRDWEVLIARPQRVLLDAVDGRDHRAPRLDAHPRKARNCTAPRARRMSYNAPMDHIATFIVVGFHCPNDRRDSRYGLRIERHHVLARGGCVARGRECQRARVRSDHDRRLGALALELRAT